VRFSGEAAVQAARWRGARKRPGGAVEVSLEMTPNEWLLGWLLGWGAEAEVTAPPALRQAVADRLAAIAEQHG